MRIAETHEDQPGSKWRLPPYALKLSVADVIVDAGDLKSAVDRHPRECPGDVMVVYDQLRLGGLRRTRKQFASVEPRRVGCQEFPGRGVSVKAFAAQIGEPPAAVKAALIRHRIAELAPYGRDQRRLVPTSTAEARGLAKLILPGLKRAQVEGAAKAAPFLVLNPARLHEVAAMLGLALARQQAAAIVNKRARIAWVIARHPGMPQGWLAALAGCSDRAIRQAQSRPAKPKVPSQVIVQKVG